MGADFTLIYTDSQVQVYISYRNNYCKHAVSSWAALFLITAALVLSYICVALDDSSLLILFLLCFIREKGTKGNGEYVGEVNQTSVGYLRRRDCIYL